MTATETHEQYVARLRRAQAQGLAKLRDSVEDRPEHVRYLRRLLAAPADRPDDVPRPAGVGMRVAAALLEDLVWLRQSSPKPGELVSPFPNAYASRRAIDAQAVAKRLRSQQARRNGTAPSLMELLKLESS